MVIDNPTLDKKRKAIRNALIRNYASKLGKTNSEAQDDCKDTDTILIPAVTNLLSQHWKKIEPYATQLSDDPSIEDDIQNRFARQITIASSIMINPPMELYTSLLGRINGILQDNIDQKMDAKQSFEAMTAEMSQYSEDVLMLIHDYRNDDSKSLPSTDDGTLWAGQDDYNRDDLDPLTDMNKHNLQDQLDILKEHLSDDRLELPIARFILNPSIGSDHYSMTDDFHTPIFTSILPEKYAQTHADYLLSTRDDQTAFEDDPDEVDSHQESIEFAFFSHYKDTQDFQLPKTTSHEEKAKEEEEKKKKEEEEKEKKKKEEQEEQSRQEREKKKKKEEEEEKKKKEEEDKKGKKKDDKEDKIPDDETDYQPGGSVSLAMRTKSITEMVQKRTPGDLSNDHMTRFGIDYERPVSMRRNEIKPGDIRINDGPSRIDPLYIVTYTRRHRKPIFNPVSGGR
jgi:hypothetical protein